MKELLILNFLETKPILLYSIIFFGKIIEVAISTLRIIFINKGNRKAGTLLAIIEIFLWIFIAGNVITGIQENYWKALFYGAGFTVGVYLGSLIEELLAVGKVLIQAVIPKETGQLIVDKLRESGHGATTVDAKGRTSDRMLLMVYTNRKMTKEITKDIKEIEPTAMIISNESNALSGGFMKEFKSLVK